jgi:hypothetical protein
MGGPPHVLSSAARAHAPPIGNAAVNPAQAHCAKHNGAYGKNWKAGTACMTRLRRLLMATNRGPLSLSSAREPNWCFCFTLQVFTASTPNGRILRPGPLQFAAPLAALDPLLLLIRIQKTGELAAQPATPPTLLQIAFKRVEVAHRIETPSPGSSLRF